MITVRIDHPMINPWQRNPLLSAWLSSANAVLGAARGRAGAELQRQMNAMAAEWTRQTLRFWSDVWAFHVSQAQARGARTKRTPRDRASRTRRTA